VLISSGRPVPPCTGVLHRNCGQLQSAIVVRTVVNRAITTRNITVANGGLVDERASPRVSQSVLIWADPYSETLSRGTVLSAIGSIGG